MLSSIPNDLSAAIDEIAKSNEAAFVAVRRDLHAHPELAMQEFRTAGIVADELAKLDILCRSGVGGTGVVGEIIGSRPGPTLVIRADMDALPITEKTELEYRSRHEGLMHACGHDIHTATLLSAASILKRFEQQLAGNVRLVFQPAEETGEGAVAMIRDGVLEGADMAIGFHNAPHIPVGEFGWCPGVSMASTDRFDIVVRGHSGHAANPSETIDPIVAACGLVGQLQTIVSREVHPRSCAVLSVGSIHGGSAFNIIPDEVAISGTVRTQDNTVRDLVEKAILRLCDSTASGMRVECRLDYKRGTPALDNDDTLLGKLVAASEAQVGAGSGRKLDPSMGGEDFAFMGEVVPSCHFMIGSATAGRKDALHSSVYQPDDACISVGARMLARAALDILN
ncbi:M20 family metallopeptidase (plasmid) [Agrobacterium leguminum]|uniref:Uncharacterized hydrolase YtnL n=1 Tax=Agrobacterium deltaense NCPPB 1641 TaxID=1183425 RepID=A0A1S7U9L0_9HYPH|nr:MULTISPECIES: M20 family metallopeptidase [Agrobacterium]WFS69626.1 M20 family metallopeptidase [Agrobacterium leguminum]CVI63610.1 Uncharacterized hydrolase YtnL [Agrobacterium deltaense NCPPB 1641]